MKKIILVILIGAAGWWYLVGSRKLTEEHVRGFYQSLEADTLQRQPEALCALLAEDFKSVGTMTGGGRSQPSELGKAETCEGYRKLFDTWAKLGDKMGGELQLDAEHTLHGIVLSADKKTATVDISSSLTVAGSIMNIRSRTTDTLVRRNGTVLLLRSEGQGSVSSGS